MIGRDPPPIPDDMMPKTVGRAPDPLANLEAELAEALRKPPEETMQDRPAPAPTPMPYAPSRPESVQSRPPLTPTTYTPPAESPVDIQFNGRRLQVKATVTTKTEAELLIGSLTALVPFLNSNGETQ